MSPIPRSTEIATSLTAQSALDTASQWATAHPAVTLTVIATMLATTALTAAIRALRRYLRLALLALLISSIPVYPAATKADLPPPPITSLFR